MKHIYSHQLLSYTRKEQDNLLGISGIQLALELQKNSPLGGNASGSSRVPTQIYRAWSLTASYSF
jgi:hypothetical protein